MFGCGVAQACRGGPRRGSRCWWSASAPATSPAATGAITAQPAPTPAMPTATPLALYLSVSSVCMLVGLPLSLSLSLSLSLCVCVCVCVFSLSPSLSLYVCVCLSICRSVSLSLFLCAGVCDGLACLAGRRSPPRPPASLSRASVRAAGAARARRPSSSCCKPVSSHLARPLRPPVRRARHGLPTPRPPPLPTQSCAHRAHRRRPVAPGPGSGGGARAGPEPRPLTDRSRTLAGSPADMLHLERLMRLCTRASAEQVCLERETETDLHIIP
eukprot:COSAG01_NODE_4739_length_4782_cov_2.805467_5_plen_271_part_00